MTIEQRSALQTLAYSSKASPTFNLADLERILEGSRRRNAAADVTGVLIFMDGVFTQYLEGPEQGITEIFDHIKASVLHHDIVELSRGSSEARQYPDWSMAYFSSQLKSAMPLTFDHLPADAAAATPQPSA